MTSVTASLPSSRKALFDREPLIAEPEIREAPAFLDRLEEMVRRREQTPEPERFVPIHRTVHCQAVTDATLLLMSIKKVVPAALVNRGSVGSIPDEPVFEVLRDMPGMMGRAARRYPTDPSGSLPKALEMERTILDGPGFEGTSETRGVVRSAGARPTLAVAVPITPFDSKCR
jgi:hypothetical protein